METIQLNNKEISLDFNSLTGKDLIDCEKEARALGDNSPNLLFSMTYQAIIAAKLLKKPVDEVLAMPAQDFRGIIFSVQSFLFN